VFLVDFQALYHCVLQPESEKSVFMLYSLNTSTTKQRELGGRAFSRLGVKYIKGVGTNK